MGHEIVIRIPLITKSTAAPSKNPARGISPRKTQEMKVVIADAVTVPRLFTIRGIIGIAISAVNSAIAIQMPAVVSSVWNRKLNHVGISCTITPRPKPEKEKTMEKFRILFPETIGSFQKGFRDFIGRALISLEVSLRLSLMKRTGIVEIATSMDMKK